MQLKEWFQLQLKKTLAMFSPGPQEPDDESIVSRCEYLYRTFPVESLEAYRQQKGVGVIVEALYHNIGKTVEQIEKHLNAIDLHGMAQPEMCQYDTTTAVRFNKFILTKEGYYQSLERSLMELRNAVLNLTIKIRAMDTPDNHGYSYTVRLLTPLFKHLIEVLSIIQEVNER